MTKVSLVNVIAIVNEGFSDLVMDVARDCGARGGTIISANGSADSKTAKLYGIAVQPEKEIILILVHSEIAETLMEKLYDKAGSGSNACGSFFALPVTHASDNLIKQYEADEDY